MLSTSPHFFVVLQKRSIKENMGRKRKELPLLEGVEITGVAAEGKSIARVNDMVVFIPYGAPGDIVDVKLDKKKHSYAEGHIVNLVKPSELRSEPFCQHFGVCGGCKWQHLPYSEQLKYKQQQVKDAMERIAKIPIPGIWNPKAFLSGYSIPLLISSNVSQHLLEKVNSSLLR